LRGRGLDPYDESVVNLSAVTSTAQTLDDIAVDVVQFSLTGATDKKPRGRVKPRPKSHHRNKNKTTATEASDVITANNDTDNPVTLLSIDES